MTSTIESYICDHEEMVINRKEVQGKLLRMNYYLSRVNARVNHLEKQMKGIDMEKTEAIKLGLDYFDLNTDIQELR